MIKKKKSQMAYSDIQALIIFWQNTADLPAAELSATIFSVKSLSKAVSAFHLPQFIFSSSFNTK